MSAGQRVWLAEKPSFAKELGKALGNCTSIERYAWQTNGGIIVAAAGHLVELAEPSDYKEEWKEWKPELLPMIPQDWEFMYKPIKGKEQQLRVINKYAKDADEIIIATDAGREGEYIAWAILQYLGLQTKPKKRLWSSGANVQSITKAAASSALLPYSEKFALAEAARIRAESDWIEGLNMTRLLTTRFRPNGHYEPISVGRVQTATLALIVARHHEIENFQPEKYYDLRVDVQVGDITLRLNHIPPEKDRIKDAAKAREISQSALNKSTVLSVKSDMRDQEPPPLFESSSLQIRAYNLWGWAADKTEELAQALYDKHKLISYPRTDGIHLEDEQWNEVAPTLINIQHLDGIDKVDLKGGQKFVDLSKHVPDPNSLSPRTTVFNSERLAKSGADHHGIIPTTEPADLSSLSDDEKKLYLLIVRQYLAQMLPDCSFNQKTISWEHMDRRFSASGRVILKQGWRVLFNNADEAAEKEENEIQEEDLGTLPDIVDGTRGLVVESAAVEKKTMAPPIFTEGSIISAMRDLTKVIKDPAVVDKIKIAKTLGTKSTWGDMVKKLKGRFYIKSTKGKLTPTFLGLDLVALCHKHIPTLVDPASTAILEYMLNEVEKKRCDTAKARKILQGRNVDAIERCIDIQDASLRAPEGVKQERKFDGPAHKFKDFEGGSYALDVPFDKKDDVKALGGRFNGETKQWHVAKNKASADELKKLGWLK